MDSTPATPRPIEVNIQQYLAAMQPRLPQWDGRWSTLPMEDRAGLVRALYRDYLQDMGEGHDWAAAGARAQFVMASLYHDTTPIPEPGISEVIWWLRCDFSPEGFEFTLRRPQQQQALPPLPGAVAANDDPPNEQPVQSLLSQSDARAPAARSVDDFQNDDIGSIVQSLGEMTRLEGREPLMLAAALLVLWKACQVSQVVAAAALYRDIHNPSIPDSRHGDARLGYSRLGPAMTQAKLASPDGGIVLLLG